MNLRYIETKFQSLSNSNWTPITYYINENYVPVNVNSEEKKLKKEEKKKNQTKERMEGKSEKKWKIEGAFDWDNSRKEEGGLWLHALVSANSTCSVLS